MLKKEARVLYKDKRAKITISERLKWDDLLLIQFQKINLPFLSSVLSYYPIEEKKEINTFIITDYIQFTNPQVHICYPKINAAENNFIAIATTDETQFIPNQYNIPEPMGELVLHPKDIDAVLIPLLAFDERGYRVGYGKGFYDRYLKECRNDCLKIGLSYFEAVDSIDDASEFDVPLDFCITPQRTYVF